MKSPIRTLMASLLAIMLALTGAAPAQTYHFRIPLDGVDGRDGSTEPQVPLAAGNYAGSYEGTSGQPLSVPAPAVSGGLAPYAYALSGSVPGMSLSGSTLTGSPATAGTYPVTLIVTDAAGATLSRSFSVTVLAPVPPGQISLSASPGLPSEAMAGTPIAPVTLTAQGGSGPLALTVTGTLPNGLSLADGTLSGTPAQAGDFTFGFSADDQDPATAPATRAVALRVYERLAGTYQAPQATATVGTAISPVQISLSGGKQPYAYGYEGTLPDGLYVTPQGVLTGTPTRAGSFSFRLRGSEAFDPSTTVQSGQYAIAVSEAPLAFNAFSVPGSMRVGTAIAGIPTGSTGGAAPVSYALTGANPVPGLEADPASGAIHGTPTAAGSYAVVLRATDSATPPQTRDSAPHPVTVREALEASFNGGAALTVREGQPFTAPVSISGAAGTPTIGMTSAPIAGVTVTTAAVSGTPSGSGRQATAARVTDPADGATAEFPVTLQVDPAASFAFSSSQGQPGLMVAGQPASVTVTKSTAAQGTTTFSNAVTATYPTTLASLGLSIADTAGGAAITGTPGASLSGAYTVNIRMTETHAGKTYPVDRQLAIQIQAPPSAGNQYPAVTDGAGNPLSTAALYDGDTNTGAAVGPGLQILKLTYGEAVAANGFQARSGRTDVAVRLDYKNAQGAWVTAGSIPANGQGNGLATFTSVSAREWQAVLTGAGAAYVLRTLKITNSTSTPTAPTAPSVSPSSNSADLTAAINNADSGSALRTRITRNTSVSWQLQAANATGATTWSVTGGSLPQGLALSPSGLISGTPTSHFEDVDVGIAVTDSTITSAAKVLKLSVRTDVQAMGGAIPTYTRGSEGGPAIDARILADNDAATTFSSVPNATTANGGAIYMNFPHIVRAAYYSSFGSSGSMKIEYKDPSDGSWKNFTTITNATQAGETFSQTYRLTAVDNANTGLVATFLIRGATDPGLVALSSGGGSYTVKRGTAASISIGVASGLHFGGNGYTGSLIWSPPASALAGLSITNASGNAATLSANAATTSSWAVGSYPVTLEASDDRSTSLPKSITINVTN